MVPEFNNAESFKLIFSNDPALKVQALKLASLDQFINSFTTGQIVSGKVIDQLASGKSLVDLGGHRAAVQFSSPPSSGQVFQARVDQLTPSPVFKILSAPSNVLSSPESGSLKPARENLVARDQVRVSAASQRTLPTPRIYSLNEITQLGLTSDKTAQGQIRAISDNQFVQVRINGQDVNILHPKASSLTVGANVTIRPEAKGEGFILTAAGAGGKNPALNLLQSLLPARQPLSSLIKDFEAQFARLTETNSTPVPPGIKGRLQESLQVLKTIQGESANTNQIRDNIFRTGASYEARLKLFLENPQNPALRNALTQDFKGQLQEFSKFLESQFGPGLKSGDSAIQSLGRQTQAVIQNLDIHQLTQVVARQENHPMSLLIPNMLEPQGKPIKVFYRDEGTGTKSKGKDGSTPYTLVFFLELSQLGNVRLDAKVQGEKLGLNVAVENETILGFIESGFSNFQDHLNELGFESELSGLVNPEKTQETFEEYPDHVMQNLSSLVDVRT